MTSTMWIECTSVTDRRTSGDSKDRAYASRDKKLKTAQFLVRTHFQLELCTLLKCVTIKLDLIKRSIISIID